MGSSKSIMAGFIASALAIATRCCWPPLSLRGYSSRLSLKPTLASSASASLMTVALSRFCTFTGASMRFSKTVIWGNRLNCWNTMPILQAMRRTSFLLTYSVPVAVSVHSASPSMITLPLSMVSSLFRQRSSVLLPPPEGPMTATTSPSLTSKSMPFKTSNLLNFFQIFCALILFIVVLLWRLGSRP